MTSDPERLLQGTSDLDDADLERELLRSIADVSAPPGARERTWQGISAQIAVATVAAAGVTAGVHGSAAASAGAVAGAGAAPKAAVGLLGTLTGKIVAGAVVVASTSAVAFGTWRAFEHRADEPVATVTTAGRPAAPAAAAPVAPTPPESAPVTEAPAPRGTRGVIANPKAVARPLTDEALAEESALLTEARADLKKGDPRAALAALNRLKQKAPRGVLMQEREVVAIQALAAAGESAAATRRARAFIKAYPNSPHSPSLRSIAGAP